MHAITEQEVETAQSSSFFAAFPQGLEQPATAAVAAVRQAQVLIQSSQAQQSAQRIIDSLQELLPGVSLVAEVSPTTQGRPGRARACAGALIVALRTAVEYCEAQKASLKANSQQDSDDTSAVTEAYAVLVDLYENEASVLVDELQACALKSDRTYKAW